MNSSKLISFSEKCVCVCVCVGEEQREGWRVLLARRRKITVRAGCNQGESESSFVYVRLSERSLKNISSFSRGQKSPRSFKRGARNEKMSDTSGITSLSVRMSSSLPPPPPPPPLTAKHSTTGVCVIHKWWWCVCVCVCWMCLNVCVTASCGK